MRTKLCKFFSEFIEKVNFLLHLAYNLGFYVFTSTITGGKLLI